MMVARPERFLLRKIAREAIQYGLKQQSVMPVELHCLPSSVTEKAASFVTLYLSGGLRGCIGSLEAYRALAEDVAANAYAAAFHDHRFEPVTEAVVNELDIHISVLTPAERLACESQSALIKQLRPGTDGLILEDDTHRATFLPAVWEALPNPERFVTELKRKAGLPVDYWSDSLRCFRYQTEQF